MASLANTVSFKIIPTDIDGICLRDLPVAEMEAMSHKLAELDASDDKSLTEIALVLFQTILCDPKGEQFDDAQTTEDIGKNLPVSLINRIMVSMSDALNPGQAHLAK